MKTFALAAMLALVPSTASAAVTITFTGATFAPSGGDQLGGSYVRTHAANGTDTYAIDQASKAVSGTIVIDTVAAGANGAIPPGAYYDNIANGGASFLTVSFTTAGVTPLKLSGMMTTQAINSDAGLEFDLFSEDSSYSYVFQLFSLSPIPTMSYGGVLLPNFLAATDLYFGVVSTVGDPAGSYVETNSLGTAVATSQAVTAVPEAATWMLMIAGFGLVGGTLRRSRRATPQLA